MLVMLSLSPLHSQMNENWFLKCICVSVCTIVVSVCTLKFFSLVLKMQITVFAWNVDSRPHYVAHQYYTTCETHITIKCETSLDVTEPSLCTDKNLWHTDFSIRFMLKLTLVLWASTDLMAPVGRNDASIKAGTWLISILTLVTHRNVVRFRFCSAQSKLCWNEPRSSGICWLH